MKNGLMDNSATDRTMEVIGTVRTVRVNNVTRMWCLLDESLWYSISNLLPAV